MMRTRSVFRTALLVVVSLINLFFTGCKQKEDPPLSTSETETPTAPQVAVVSTYPIDGGRLLQLDHPVYVDLSAPVKPEQLSFTITPSCGKWRVQWRNKGRQAVLNHSQPFKGGQQYTLSLALKPAGGEKQVQFTAFGPTSIELIDAAQQKGTIDTNQAWTYRMQSVFEPDKLPEQYRSPTPLKDADWLVRDYLKAKSQLDPDTTKTLDRYLKRPDDPQSFLYDAYTAPPEQFSRFPQIGPRAAWADDPLYPRPEYEKPFNIDCDTGQIKVWAPMHMKEKAIDVKNKIDTPYKRGYMYPSFKQLLGGPPQSDIRDRPNGGDERLDIYVLPPDKIVAPGMCRPCPAYASEQYDKNSSTEPRRRPGYIFIKGSLSGEKLAAALAHEMFHAFQYNFDFSEDHWWVEATAKWAEDYIEQSWDFEQDSIPYAFDRESNALRTLTIADSFHEYGIYLYPYFLSNEYGDEVIAKIWKACEKKASLEALDKEVPGGLDESLKRFALPTMDYGKYQGKIRKPGEKYMFLQNEHSFKEIYITTPDKPISETIKIPPLGVAYVYVSLILNHPESTPMVRFDLKAFANNEDLTIQAVFDKDAREEDWTGLEEKELCLNKNEEKFNDIAIVVTNNNRNPDALLWTDIYPDDSWAKAEIEIELDAEGCKEAEATAIVTATLKEETHTKWEDTSPHGDVKKTQTDLEGGGTATIRLTLEKKDSSYDKQTKTVTRFYDIKDSTVQSFTIHGRSYYSTYDYDKDRDCACTKKIIKNPTLGHYDLEDSGGMSITFDSETMKAKYVALPALVVFHDTTEKSKTTYEGCCGSEGDEQTIDMKRIPFAVGSVKAKDSEQLAREAKPEFDQMKKIAQDSRKLAEEIMGKMGELKGMDDQQTEEFYQNLDERVEEFTKQHNIDQLAQNIQKKVVPADLKVTSGDGKHSISGGGKRTDTEKIENGTTSREYDLKWRITLKERPASE